jgi:hypothetical protein
MVVEEAEQELLIIHLNNQEELVHLVVVDQDRIMVILE